jgi:hypothetical protein
MPTTARSLCRTPHLACFLRFFIVTRCWYADNDRHWRLPGLPEKADFGGMKRKEKGRDAVRIRKYSGYRLQSDRQIARQPDSSNRMLACRTAIRRRDAGLSENGRASTR